MNPTYAIKANNQQSCLSDSHPWSLELIQLYIIRFVSDLQHISALTPTFAVFQLYCGVVKKQITKHKYVRGTVLSKHTILKYYQL
jgi:hypothetical protein